MLKLRKKLSNQKRLRKTVEAVKPEVKSEEKVETNEETSESSEPQTIQTKYKVLSGPKITGKTIDLKQFEKKT